MPVYRGEIKNQRKSLLRLIRALSPNGEVVSFCYEAGACGYGVYREIFAEIPIGRIAFGYIYRVRFGLLGDTRAELNGGTDNEHNPRYK